MDFRIFSLSLYSIRRHTLRTFLTILGICISTFFLTLFFIVFDSVKYTVRVAEERLGGMVITIDKEDWEKDRQTDYEEILRRKDFSKAEIEDIASLPEVKTMVILYVSSNKVALGSKELRNVKIVATTPQYFLMHNYKVERGTIFTFLDNEEEKRVCIVGKDVESGLEDTLLLGKFIDIGGVPFKVIGILERIGNFFEMKPDEVVIIPISTFERFLKEENDYFVIELLPKENVKRDFLLQRLYEVISRHRKGLGREGIFAINTLEKKMGFLKGISTNIFGFLFFFSIVMLLVGCINISNLMLATLSERIKEIGVLKSIGATDSFIFILFVIEPAVLGVIGSSVGVPIGTVVGLIGLSISKGILFRFPFLPILGSVLITVFSAILASLYSAYRATKYEVIEALRAL